MKKTILLASFFYTLAATAQVKIGDNPTSMNPRSLLELESTTKGLLLPRMTNTQIRAMTGVPAGMLVFSSSDSALYLRRDTGWAILSLAANQQAATNSWATNGTILYNTSAAKVGIGTSNPYSQLANTSVNTIDPDGYGGNPLSFAWAGSQDGYIGQFYNGGTFASSNGVTVKVNNSSATALDVSRGAQSSAGTPLLTVKANGRVGINNASPQQALDVAGTARAQQFSYATPQTYYLSIPFDAFTSDNASAYRITVDIIPFNGANIPAYMYLTGGTAGQPGYISAPVNLPQGAVITNMELTAEDNDGSSVVPQLTISGLSPVSGSENLGVALSSLVSLTTESASWQTVSLAVSHVVRNDLNVYKVGVRLNQNSTGTRLHGVRITYTVSNL